jgi:hypothetical protein
MSYGRGRSALTAQRLRIAFLLVDPRDNAHRGQHCAYDGYPCHSYTFLADSRSIQALRTTVSIVRTP